MIKRKAILLFVFVLSAIFDLTITAYNMATRPLNLEINPLYRLTGSMWGVHAANIFSVLFVIYLLLKYQERTQFQRYFIVMFIMAVTLLHLFGGWTNIRSIQVQPNTETMTRAERDIYVYENMPSEENLNQESYTMSYWIYAYLISLVLIFKTWEWVENEQ